MGPKQYGRKKKMVKPAGGLRRGGCGVHAIVLAKTAQFVDESSVEGARILALPRDWSAYLNARMLSTEAMRTTKMIRIRNSFARINGARHVEVPGCVSIERDDHSWSGWAQPDPEDRAVPYDDAGAGGLADREGDRYEGLAVATLDEKQDRFATGLARISNCCLGFLG